METVGFDFGTTNSLVSIVRGGRAINFLDDEQRPIPSIVCYEGARTIAGRRARQRLEQAGLGVQGNVVRSPKMFLGGDSIHVEGTERSPVDVVADVVTHVVAEARRGNRDPGPLTHAVVTIPVDMAGFRRRALRDAFLKAGVTIVQFVHEPLAALYGYFRGLDLRAMLRRYDRKLVLVFDWGGGTLDLTLCRPMGNMVVQLMNDGTDEVGGDVFDETVMNHLLKQLLADRGFGDGVEIQPGAKARLIERCESAKIDLSERRSSTIYVSDFFRGAGDPDFDWALTQEDLERIVAPLLEKGLQRIKRLLDDAGYAPEQVAMCLATGGMSNMPAVRRRLHEWFGPERVHIPKQAATLIAEGAAWIAADGAGLQLAKDVELELARNSYLPLLKRGTEMPRHGEVRRDSFHLYCTDPRDGTAKFQIYAPKRAGEASLPSEPRTCLETMTIKVDSKAKAFRERLELDVEVDENLVLTAHARSLNVGDEDLRHIHNLEFGLRFPDVVSSTGNDEGSASTGPGKGTAKRRKTTKDRSVTAQRGSLCIRSNIADRKDDQLVPGEFLYEYDPHYFDVRQNPPMIQEEEKLYYQPCAMCGRSSNDPACRCSVQLGT